MNANAYERLAERYRRREAERAPRLARFHAGQQPFLVIQRPNHPPVWTDCGTPESIARHNLDAFAAWLAVDATDELPYLEPWAGTGVYANAFGSPYDWPPGESPGTLYAYGSLEETEGFARPDWRTAPIMRLVLESIDRMRELAGERLPITLTDTQSPLDTATLIVDASAFLIGCHERPDLADALLEAITDLIVDFSREQIRRIGEASWSRPGHLMVSSPAGAGLSLSDDNLSFCSPEFNRRFALPHNYRLAGAFGGVAIHSCGVWTHTMRILERSRGVTAIDCAIHTADDPSPNNPAAVRDALRGKGIVAKVRCGAPIPECLDMLSELAAPDLPLVVQIAYDADNADENHARVSEHLASLYHGR